MSKKKQKTIPTSVLGRATRLFAAGAALVGKEVASRVVDSVSRIADDQRLQNRISQAATVVDALSNMKGAAMKAGQILSLEFSDLLPPEVTDVLRKLHDDSTSLPFDKVEKLLKKELGAENYGRLEQLSREPIAAASIGQVHSAMIDGQKVAVKLQFPGVDKTIGSDLSLVKQAMQSVLWLQKRKIPLDGLFEEFERILRQEVDYRKEAKFIQQFRELTAEESSYVVPKVRPEFSTKRVLTLSFEEGQRLKEWLRSKITREEKERFADLVLALLHKEFFEWGLVQTDPNYGNFLFRPSTFQLVLLDFGATNAYSKKLRREVRELLRAAMANDDEKLIRIAGEYGILDPREKDTVKRDFCTMMQIIVRIFRPELQPFDFSDLNYLQEIRAVTLGFANQVQYTAPAKQLIFLNRKLGGMFHLLKDIGGSTDLAKFWSRVDEMSL